MTAENDNLKCRNTIRAIIIAYKNLELAYEDMREYKWKEAQESTIWSKSYLYDIVKKQAIPDESIEEQVTNLCLSLKELEDILSEYSKKTPESHLEIAKTIANVEMAQGSILDSAPIIIKSVCKCEFGEK